MGDIQRGIKTYGTRQFVTELAAAPGNKAPILSAEVDYDLNLIYNTWNTGIDITDLKTGFIIDHAHLGTDAVESNNIKDGTIAHADLGPDCVWSNNIKDGSIIAADLASDAVTTVKILDGNVTKEKLAPSATVGSIGWQKRGDADNIIISSGQTANYLTVSNISVRNVFTPVILRVNVFGFMAAGGVDTFIQVIVKRGGGEIFRSTRKSQGNNIAWSLYVEDVVVLPTTAAHSFSVDVASSGGMVILDGGGLFVLRASVMEYRPLVLTNGKLEYLWNRMSMYPQLFDDVIPRTFEAFKETMLAPTNQFYEIIDSDETVGLAAATQVRPKLDANMHVVMFDRRLRGREPVLLEALRDFGIRAQLRRMTVALPEDNRTAIKLVERLGFKLEGVMRRAHLRDGIYRDYHIYGILAEELYSYGDSGRPAHPEPDGRDIREPIRGEANEVRPDGLPQEDEHHS